MPTSPRVFSLAASEYAQVVALSAHIEEIERRCFFAYRRALRFASRNKKQILREPVCLLLAFRLPAASRPAHTVVYAALC